MLANRRAALEEVEELTMPERTPPDPRPAMVLPRMKATEFGAAPQRAEPASNRRMDVMKMALMLKTVYSFPNTNWKAQLVSRYAVPYQPISPAELNSSVICGIAVEMMRRSYERGCQFMLPWTRSANITYQRHQEHAYEDRTHKKCELET